MVVVILALLAVAVTAAVVIRDAHPPAPHPATETPRPTPEHAPAGEPVDAPTQAIDMTQLVAETPPTGDGSVDALTQSMPVPLSFGAQAAAILPYPTSVAEPIAKPAAFIPVGKPHLQPDPDRLIQNEIVIEDVAHAHSIALRRLAIGMAALTGLVFGYGPARRAASLDPVIALKSE